MGWDGCSDAGSNARSKCNWSTWNETHTMHMMVMNEAPPLFLKQVLAWLFLQKIGLEAREKHDTGCNR